VSPAVEYGDRVTGGKPQDVRDVMGLVAWSVEYAVHRDLVRDVQATAGFSGGFAGGHDA
jgi:hypothetical protein